MKKKILFKIILILLAFCHESNSQITFQKAYGGTDDDMGFDVQLTLDGGYIVTGMTDNFSTNIGADVYVIKTNELGDTVWTRTFSRISYECGYSIKQTADSGYIVGGSSGGVYYMIKLTPFGIRSWSTSFGDGSTNIGYDAIQTYDGGYVITGEAMTVVKTDANGNKVWAKKYGTVNDYGYSLIQTSDSGIVLAGVYSGDMYAVKMNAVGDTIWAKRYGGINSDVAYCIKQTSDGGFIMTGYTLGFGVVQGDVYLVKIDGNGNLLWSKTYGGNLIDIGNSVAQTTDGGYIITGYTASFGASTVSTDVYLIKTDANGDTLWTRTFGKSNADVGESVQQTNDGGYIITGHITGFASGQKDLYLIKTDLNGNSGCDQYSTNTVVGNPATQVTNVSVNTASSFNGGTGGTTTKTGANITTFCNFVGVNETLGEISVVISPNPVNNLLNIKLLHPVSNGIVEVLSTLGQKFISSGIANQTNININTGNIPSGIYIVQLSDGNQKVIRKFVKN